MNNIEKLQKIFQELKKDDESGHSSAYELQWEDIEAIENLIQENKELKNKCNELNFKYTAQWVDDNFIPKSKVKEKIEVIQKRMKEETRTDFLITLKILENELQELLEEGE